MNEIKVIEMTPEIRLFKKYYEIFFLEKLYKRAKVTALFIVLFYFVFGAILFKVNNLSVYLSLFGSFPLFLVYIYAPWIMWRLEFSGYKYSSVKTVSVCVNSKEILVKDEFENNKVEIYNPCNVKKILNDGRAYILIKDDGVLLLPMEVVTSTVKEFFENLHVKAKNCRPPQVYSPPWFSVFK